VGRQVKTGPLCSTIFPDVMGVGFQNTAKDAALLLGTPPKSALQHFSSQAPRRSLANDARRDGLGFA
jgi:hypothetical protein